MNGSIKKGTEHSNVTRWGVAPFVKLKCVDCIGHIRKQGEKKNNRERKEGARKKS